MKATRQRIIRLALAGAITSSAITGCDQKRDAISTAEQGDKEVGITAPGIEETKAIAEEGFIYGLPLVMNYAVMNEFCVDPKSSQYKGPFNQSLFITVFHTDRGTKESAARERGRDFRL